MEIAVVLVAAAVAALIGLTGPRVIAALPEPAPDPDDPKPLYADIAAAPRLAWWLAAGAAVMATLAAARLDVLELVPAWVLFTGVGSWLTYVDWRTRLLPYRITGPLHLATLALVALAAALLQDWSVLVRGLIGNVGVFVAFWLIYQLGRFFRGGAFGYGDVRLAGIIGLVLGPLGAGATIVGTYGGFVLGAVGGLVLSRLGLVDPKGFAFGPYLVVGAVLGVVVAG